MLFSLLFLMNQINENHYKSVIIIIIESSPAYMVVIKLVIFFSRGITYNAFRLLPHTFLAACPAEKEVIDVIRKQNEEVTKQQEKVKNLVDRIAAEIERSSCFEGR